MNKFLKYLIPAIVLAAVFTGCKKADKLPYYESGMPSELSASTTTPSTALSDSSKNVITFSWSDPKFATDTAHYKYVLEIAPTGTDFSHPASYTIMTARNMSLTGKQLNNLLVAWGANFGTPKDLDVRLKASYANNNDLKISNILKITAAPMAKPFALSTSSNGIFAPTPQTKDDKLAILNWKQPDYGDTITFTYSIQYARTGAGFNKAAELSVESGTTRALTGIELYSMAVAAGIPLGSTGSVDVRVKAVTNTKTVSYSTAQTLKITPVEMILYLYMAGDFQGWNPSTAPAIASNDGVNYEGYVWVPTGGSGEFKFTSAPDWNHTNYGNGGGNKIDPAKNDNLKWPATGKYYLVKVNMNAMSWSATEIKWGLIGDATPGGWDNSTPMTYNVSTKKWTATINFAANGAWKFRANNSWDINLGGAGTYLSYGGDNFATPGTGTKTITLDLSNPLKYSYIIR